MSDIASELPIRSQLAGQVLPDDVIVKIGDGANPTTQFLAVDSAGKVFAKLNDGAGNNVTSQANGAQQALDVGINVSGAQIDPRQIRALTSTDVVTAIQGSAAATHASPWWVRLTDGTNNSALLSTGELKVAVTQLLTEDHNYGTVGANTLRIASQIGNATGAADFNFGAASAQTIRVAALLGNASGLIDYNYGATDAQTIRTAAQIGNATGAADFNNGATGAQTLRTAANLAVGGANVSGTNPVPVSFSSAPLGTPVNNYNTASAIVAGATSNHIYTITTGKTFQGKKIWASASGLMKIEVRVSPDGSTYSTLWVAFNSTSEPNITIDMDQMVFLESGVGSTIEIIRTNKDNKAMDLYSTISGTEI